MKHLVYLTTNNINNKIYIGIHSTDNINDGYIGSGIAFTDAVKKYGRTNFTRKILHYCDTREEASDYEEFYVTKEFIEERTNYNLTVGGNNRSLFSESSKRQMSQSTIESLKNPEYRKKLSIAAKNNMTPERKKQISIDVRKGMTKEVCKHISDKMKLRGCSDTQRKVLKQNAINNANKTRGTKKDKEFKKKISESRLANPIQPWDNGGAKLSQHIWANAEDIFKWWEPLSATPRKCGYTAAAIKFKEPAEFKQRFVIILKMFKNGWIPSEDENWVKRFNNK